MQHARLKSSMWSSASAHAPGGRAAAISYVTNIILKFHQASDLVDGEPTGSRNSQVSGWAARDMRHARPSANPHKTHFTMLPGFETQRPTGAGVMVRLEVAAGGM
jgi:hypothetical protein